MPARREVSIRLATQADAPAIHDLHLRSVRALCSPYYEHDVIEGWLGGRSPSGYLRGISSGAIFVAEVHTQLLGFGEAVRGEILAIYVDPRWVGRGVGRRLLSEALDLAAAPLGSVRLEATLNAVSFYERGGFSQVGQATVRRNDVDVPVVIMEKRGV